MSAAFERASSAMMRDFGTSLVDTLALKYNFSSEEARRHLGLDTIKSKKTERKTKSNWKTPSVMLPWTGKSLPTGFCQGLRLNHGLHSQCVLEASAGELYCKGCATQAGKNESGKPTYGTVEDRMAVGLLEYRDPKEGKQTVPYANVMDKLGVTRSAAEGAAAEFGLTIPEEHFVKRVGKRGRPAAVKPTADSDEESQPKKGRGRPKKAKKVIETSAGDDLIASLVKQAAKKKSSAKAKRMASPGGSPKVARKKKVLSDEEKEG